MVVEEAQGKQKEEERETMNLKRENEHKSSLLSTIISIVVMTHLKLV